MQLIALTLLVFSLFTPESYKQRTSGDRRAPDNYITLFPYGPTIDDDLFTDRSLSMFKAGNFC